MGKRISQHSLTLLALAIFQIHPSAWAQEVSIPGTSVSLVPPSGFTLSQSFTGMEHPDGSKIRITEFPADEYDEVTEWLSDPDRLTEFYEQRNIRISIDRVDEVATAGQLVHVVIGRQPALVPGGTIGKYVALFRGELTVLLFFDVVDSQTLPWPTVESVIRSVRLSSVTTEQRLDQLPFTFNVVTPFRLKYVIFHEGVVLSTYEGADPTGELPKIIIALSFSPVYPPDAEDGFVPRAVHPWSDAESLALVRLKRTEGLEEARVTKSEDVHFAGGRANYLEATAGNLRVMQYLRILPDWTHIRLLAVAGAQEIEAVLPAVAEIAESVSMRAESQ